MANRSRQTFIKRQKERARQEKQRQKAEKRAQRKSDRTKIDAADGNDPDIAGIVPGPQPLPWETEDLLLEEELTAEEREAREESAQAEG